uniref:Uncharacterized protein n=1 Tax=Tetradesmus obliquus TaxID=3088 RepID=A0A383VFL2_TETOB|eukprot:jgi/Sobl393_1/17523/SZX63971.1
MSVDAAVFDVLPYCCRQLGLQGLACLAASSRQLRTISLGLLPKDGSMLRDALEAAATAAAASAAAPSTPAAAVAAAAGAAEQTPHAAPAGASRADKQAKHHLQAVTWLLSHSPTAAAAVGVAERALQVPAVPVDWAKHVLAAGMKMTYAQLVAAAHSMVAGGEVWVQAQHELGLQTDVPQAAVTICWPGTWPIAWFSYLTVAVCCRSSGRSAAAQQHA